MIRNVLVGLAFATTSLASSSACVAQSAFHSRLLATATGISDTERKKYFEAGRVFCENNAREAVSECMHDQVNSIISISHSRTTIEDYGKYWANTNLYVEKCSSLHRSHGESDNRILSYCLESVSNIVAHSYDKSNDPNVIGFDIKSYCQKVAQVSGGSYAIMEACLLSEQQAKRRLEGQAK